MTQRIISLARCCYSDIYIIYRIGAKHQMHLFQAHRLQNRRCSIGIIDFHKSLAITGITWIMLFQVHPFVAAKTLVIS